MKSLLVPLDDGSLIPKHVDNTHAVSIAHRDKLARQEQRIGLAQQALRAEGELLHRAGKPLVLGKEGREVKRKYTSEEPSADEPFPSLW